jgi:hypothetical protein
MNDESMIWSCEIELAPGERLQVPTEIAAQVGSGRWRLIVEPIEEGVRSHAAFLNSYAPADEGLYDDCVRG